MFDMRFLRHALMCIFVIQSLCWIHSCIFHALRFSSRLQRGCRQVPQSLVPILTDALVKQISDDSAASITLRQDTRLGAAVSSIFLCFPVELNEILAPDWTPWLTPAMIFSDKFRRNLGYSLVLFSGSPEVGPWEFSDGIVILPVRDVHPKLGDSRI